MCWNCFDRQFYYNIKPKRCTRCMGRIEMEPREIAMRTAWAYLGKPYVWGGDDPIAGFDCSGYVIEYCKSGGVLPREGDWRARDLYPMFPIVDEPYEGCLVFYGDPIIHVEICIDSVFSIGASGGGSSTNTLADAIKQNAYIKIRPFRSRDGIYGFVDPFKNG